RQHFARKFRQILSECGFGADFCPRVAIRKARRRPCKPDYETVIRCATGGQFLNDLRPRRPFRRGTVLARVWRSRGEKMRRFKRLLTVLIVLCSSAHPGAQQTIISSGRSVDWTKPGVAGGIPARTTVCATLNPGATAAQIKSAISACPSGQV